MSDYPNLEQEHVCCNVEELETLRTYRDLTSAFLRTLVATDPQVQAMIPFIIGTNIEKMSDGLGEEIYVCPFYGSDVTYTYKRVKSSNSKYRDESKT